jgi:hypothetical protein
VARPSFLSGRTPKFYFKNKCKMKAPANHRTVNYRSGIIAVMQSIVGSPDANPTAPHSEAVDTALFAGGEFML